MYNHDGVERRWQHRWREVGAFSTPEPSPELEDRYVFAACPFTSGDAHIGHVRSYAISDAYARFLRARGYAVLFSLGFDAFGLPAEQAAIERNLPPGHWVEICADRMKSQFDRLGFSFDWSRQFITSHPSMYRWTQWLFLRFLEKGLVYEAEAPADWCDQCNSALAPSQVIDGACWRCQSPVRTVKIKQWHLRITAYNDEAASAVASLVGWNKNAVGAQRAVIGETKGVTVELARADGRTLTAFTPWRDHLLDSRYVAVSPNYPDLKTWLSKPEARQGVEELRNHGWRRSDRSVNQLPIVDTGENVSFEGNALCLPVVVTPAVDGRFGATAVLGVPGVDRTDAALGERVREATGGAKGPPPTATPAVRYRIKDFPISRQRSWGAPIPIVHCHACGSVPVPDADLPVVLPDDVIPTGIGNPLASHPDFVHCNCPECGGPARRDTNTLDCHVDGLWFWVASCVRPEERDEAMFEHPELQRWLPIHKVVWGADGGGYMFDIRVVTRALRDLGPWSFMTDGEPYMSVMMHEMVRMSGRKMSKHLGNVIDPERIVHKLGADALRFAVLSAAAPAKTFTWADSLPFESARFLGRVWEFCTQRAERLRAARRVDQDDNEELRACLRLWSSAALTQTTDAMERLDFHLAAKNVMTFFSKLEYFEKLVEQRQRTMNDADWSAMADAVRLLLRLMAPIVPHLAEELWAEVGEEQLLATTVHWPEMASPT